MKKKVIDKLIGNRIEEMRITSFYIKEELICDVIALYIKTEGHRWYKFTTSDGVNIIEYIIDEPTLLSINMIKDEFAYPTRTIQNKYIGHVITDIKSYSFQGKQDEQNGFYIELEDMDGFSLYEIDDCLLILDGVKLQENYILSSMK